MSHTGIRGEESVSVCSFLNDLDKYRHLSQEEEQRLAVIISTAPLDEDGKPTGEEAREAINKLVLHNMKFAAKCAKRYSHRGVPIDDLISSTIPNMVRAAEKFQPGRGKFISYAAMWVRVALQECVSRQARAVTLPTHSAGFVYIIMQQFEKNHKEGVRCELDVDELVKSTGRPVNEILPAVSMMHRHQELNVREEKSPAGHRHEWWPDTQSTPPDAIAQHLDDVRMIDLLLEGMSLKQQQAIRDVYFSGKTPVEVAAERGVSRQAIDWTLGKAISNARKRASRLKAMGVL
jgi:RNA polymerase sigma factor (sigma-70 family)